MVDVMRVPERCENRVRKSEDKNILCRFLAKKMVDPVGLLFVERTADDAIELARRGEIGSERFFDNYADPASLARFIQAGGFQVLENRFELIRSGRKIKKAIAAGAMVFVDFIQAFGQSFVTRFVFKLTPMIKNRLRKCLPDFVANS